MKVRARVFVSGRVQGVFFRSEARFEAEKLSVKGWIRNLRDGRVEAVFEGEEEAVRQLIDFCRQGSRSSRVTYVDVNFEEYTGEFKSFKITYSL